MGYNTNFSNYSQRGTAPYAQGPFTDPNGEPQESAPRGYNNRRSYHSSSPSSSRGGPLEFQIVRPIGVLQENTNSNWRRELNIVSWNNNAPKYDIRDWSPAHNKMSKGISLSLDEMVRLYEILHNEVMYLQSGAMNPNNVYNIGNAGNAGNTGTAIISPDSTAPMATVAVMPPMPMAAPATPLAPTSMPPMAAAAPAPQAPLSPLDAIAPLSNNASLANPANSAATFPTGIVPTTDPFASASALAATLVPPSAQTSSAGAVPPLPSNSTTMFNEQIPQFNQPLDNTAAATIPTPTAVADPAFGASSFADNAFHGKQEVKPPLATNESLPAMPIKPQNTDTSNAAGAEQILTPPLIPIEEQ